MKKPTYVKVSLITGLIFVLLISHLSVLYTLFYHPLTGAPTAGDGSIDLTGVSPARTIVLDGKWDFYWNRMIATEPDQSEKSDFLIGVPNYWSRYQIDGKWLPASGIASYRLTLKGVTDPRPVTVWLPDFGSAYHVFIDGTLAAESGTLSQNAENIFTTPESTLHPVTLSSGATHTVVIEVATTRFSGLYMAPVLQEYDSAMRENAAREAVRYILFGTALSSFLLLIVLYALSFRKSKRSVWLPAMGFFVILRIMLTTEFYGFWQKTVFFNLSYEATNALMFFVTFSLQFLLIFLIQNQLGIVFSKREKYCFLVYYIVIYLAYLVIPHGFYNRHLTVLLPVATFALEFYAFIKIYRNRKKLIRFGLLIYWGTIFAVTGLIIDCYYINGNIYLNLSLALLTAFTAYLIILDIVYALRVADLYGEFALFSARLTLAGNQIAMQKEYYDALSGQMNEIRAIRHDARHFIGVLRRLAEEGRYLELRTFLAEYANKTDTDPLPVFCEHIVANSILGYYSLKARENSVPFRCTCAIPKQLSVSDTDLCVVLGNGLENAIEANMRLDDLNTRFVSAEARIRNGQLLIKIENVYDGSLNMSGNDYLSTKSGAFHGIGLHNIQRVVETYGGYVKAEHTGRVFTLMAAFPCSPVMAEKQAGGQTGSYF